MQSTRHCAEGSLAANEEIWAPIRADQLRVGHYIKINHRWFDHPFVRRIFRITSEDEVAIIRNARLTKLLRGPCALHAGGAARGAAAPAGRRAARRRTHRRADGREARGIRAHPGTPRRAGGGGAALWRDRGGDRSNCWTCSMPAMRAARSCWPVQRASWCRRWQTGRRHWRWWPRRRRSATRNASCGWPRMPWVSVVCWDGGWISTRSSSRSSPWLQPCTCADCSGCQRR